jgi:hypothetical protein
MAIAHDAGGVARRASGADLIEAMSALAPALDISSPRGGTP